MRKHDLGYEPSGGADGEAMLDELDAFEAALRDPGDGEAGEADAFAQTDQMARDIAAIERATAALRKAEPALETWSQPASEAWTSDPPVIAKRNPHPVWLLIGLLWLSTALVTAGAVAAIAVLAG
jgi:hypothetical protein